MPRTIVSTPQKYAFGETFDYTSWPKNTELTLLNVNWNNDYRDIVRFTSQGALDTWIDSRTNVKIEHVSQRKFSQLTVRIELPVNAAMDFNYLRVTNPLFPVRGDVKRNYYYFILDVANVNQQVTELTLQLDIWQTFGYEVTFGQSFVSQGHLGIANEHAFDNYGRDYLNIPEGLDVGGEYRIVKTARETVMSLTDYSVLICSTVDLTKDPGTESAPKLTTSPGSTVDGISSGAAFYVFPTPADFRTFMKEYASFPWITQGLISASLIPDITRYHSGSFTNVASDVYNAVQLPSGGGVTVVSPPDFTMYSYPASASTIASNPLATAWRDSLLNVLDPQYRGLKKFLTYPYCMIELTTWTASPLVIKPEAWADPDATIREMATMLPPGARIAFMPYRYNGDDATTPIDGGDDNAEDLDFATTLDNFVQVPLVNNMYIGYMAANKNGIAFQFANASWDQQKSLRGAQATADVAGADIRNTARQAAAGVTATAAGAALAATTSMNNAMLGLIPGAATGGVESATEGMDPVLATGMAAAKIAGGTMIAGNTANAMLQGAEIANTARAAGAASGIRATADIRDTNVSLAHFAARGDYQNQVAGINARLQDARLTQPSVSGQFNGDALNLAHSRVEVSARWKMVDKSTVRRIGNYWLRYGYAIDQFVNVNDVAPDLMCMSKFTYWKMSEVYITNGTIPERFKQGIRGIFEKGVTVWADPTYIGNTALSDNTPRAGVGY